MRDETKTPAEWPVFFGLCSLSFSWLSGWSGFPLGDDDLSFSWDLILVLHDDVVSLQTHLEAMVARPSKKRASPSSMVS